VGFGSSVEAETERAQRLARKIAERASYYYPELRAACARAEYQREFRGARSTVFQFELGDGSLRRSLMVKVPAPTADASEPEPAHADRPRLAPVLAARERIESEHAALTAIEARIEALGRAEFGCIRVLDFLADERALVTERATDPPLKQWLARAHRFAPATAPVRLAAAFRNTGAWLRHYHELPPLEHTRTRGETVQEFRESMAALAGYLVGAGVPSGVAELAQHCERAAGRLLPARLPLGTNHGDLAPRNVLVDPGGRVTLIDTRAAWRAPRWEDLAYFGVSVRSARAQLYSGGHYLSAELVGGLERSFLSGYFGSEAIPEAQIRLMSVLCTLDRWASLVSEDARAGLGQRISRAVRDRTLWRVLSATARGI
jgi:hypothetical protein